MNNTNKACNTTYSHTCLNKSKKTKHEKNPTAKRNVNGKTQKMLIKIKQNRKKNIHRLPR